MERSTLSSRATFDTVSVCEVSDGTCAVVCFLKEILPPRQLPHSLSELLRGETQKQTKCIRKHFEIVNFLCFLEMSARNSCKEEMIRKNSGKKKRQSVQMCSCRGDSDGYWVNLSPFGILMMHLCSSGVFHLRFPQVHLCCINIRKITELNPPPQKKKDEQLV